MYMFIFVVLDSVQFPNQMELDSAAKKVFSLCVVEQIVVIIVKIFPEILL